MPKGVSNHSQKVKDFFLDFSSFGYKQAYACIFGVFLLLLIVTTKYYYPLDEHLYRYDFLFLSAILFQVLLVTMRLESRRELLVILLFHAVAMAMELFKTHPSIGSWNYPESFIIGYMGVPFFAGFMYSAVGSYIARVWRIFQFRFKNFPKRIYSIFIALGIYINFFTHHFFFDFRYFLILSVLLTFGRTTIFFTPRQKEYSMNLAFGFLLVSFFIWIAENIATYMKIWTYPNQIQTWNIVGVEKITAWFLLMIISFVLISLIHKPEKAK